MTRVKKVRIYFDDKSSKYQENSTSFPWDFIRKYEKKIVTSLIGNVKNQIIADIGSGSGFYTKLLLKDKPKEIFAIDNSKKMLDKINDRKIKKIFQNAEFLKLNKKFDKILCAGLIEFVGNPIKVLKNINKVGKKDAILVLLCPKNNIFGKLYKYFHLTNNFKINLFTFDEINILLKKTGWKVISKDDFLFSMVLKLKKNG